MTVNDGVAWQDGSRAIANSCNDAYRFWSIHMIPLDPPPDTGNTGQDALNLRRWKRCIEEWKCTKCGLRWGPVKTGACLACAANFCEACWHAHWYVMHPLLNDDICPWTDQNQDVVSADQNQVPVVDQTIVPETGEDDPFQMQVSDEILTETGLGDWTSETEVEEVSLGSTWVFGESGSILDISSMELAPPPDEDTLGETTDQANPQE